MFVCVCVCSLSVLRLASTSVSLFCLVGGWFCVELLLTLGTVGESLSVAAVFGEVASVMP